MIDFDNKKILILSDQTESTKGKNIVTDNNAAPRMIKSKNSEIGQQKVGERKRKPAPKLNPTVKQLLNKYTSRKANNVFSRLGGTKHLRSPSRPRGHDHWRGNSYDRHGCFPIKPTYWSCSPPRHSQFSSWHFTPWVPYPTRLARYLRPEWVPLKPMFRAKWHEKRVQLNKEARSHDATTLHNAYGKNYNGDCKLVWVPVKHVEPKLVKHSVDLCAANDLKLGERQSAEGLLNNPETSNIVGVGSVQKKVIDEEKDGKLQQMGPDQFAKEASLEAHVQNCKDQESSMSTNTSQKFESANMCTVSAMKGIGSRTSMHSQLMVFKHSTSICTDRGDSINRDIQGTKTGHVLKAVELEIVDGGSAMQQEREHGLVQKETGSELRLQNGGYTLSSSTSKKTDSASICTNAIIRRSSLRPSTSISPSGLKSSTAQNIYLAVMRTSSANISTHFSESSNRGSQQIKVGNVLDQRRMFLAKEKLFAPRTSVSQYWPRNLGGSRIKSVAPRTKPQSQWCPTGLTHTQKRRVQRLRMLEIREEIAEKRRNEYSS
jgi:hypothetical protein